MNIKDTLVSLSEVSGAAGDEGRAAELALGMLKKYCPDAEIVSGNVIGHFGEQNDSLPTLLLDAHIDQIGFIVTDITDDGFIKTGNLGGIDRRLLPAQQVVIHGSSDICGIVCSVPPHLSSGEEKVLSFSEAAIDTGLSKPELEKIVSKGDSVTFDVKCRQLLGQRMTGGAFDDRSGVASILYALDLLGDSPLAFNIAVMFSAQEEVGERGAKTGAYAIDPDVAIAVDVSFAFSPGETEYKCGHLGKGPMIGISPSLSREISNKLIDAAEKSEIKYQIEIMNDLTSTNADRFSVTREGVKACTVSIPLRNMHTPVEVIDLDDIKLTGELLAAFAKEGL